MTSIVQADIDNLESALVSGELQVRIGDRWITYRSVEELKAALSFAKEQLNASDPTVNKATAYVASLDRGI